MLRLCYRWQYTPALCPCQTSFASHRRHLLRIYSIKVLCSMLIMRA